MSLEELRQKLLNLFSDMFLACSIPESSLDESIPKNVGFVVPVDEPGIEAKRPCCVSSQFAIVTDACLSLVTY